jgi:hypothetical protein
MLSNISKDLLNKNRVLTMSNNRKCNYLIVDFSNAETVMMGINTQGNTKDIIVNNTKIDKFKNKEEIIKYLQKNYSKLKTCIGETSFIYNVESNSKKNIPYDYKIMAQYDDSFFKGAIDNAEYTDTQKNTLRKELKNFQEKIASDLIKSLPNKKLTGGYYRVWHYRLIKYPNKTEEGTKVVQYYSWTNYADTAKKDTDYENWYEHTKIAKFQWYNKYDQEL